MQYLLKAIMNENMCLERLMLSFKTCQNIHAGTNQLSIWLYETMHNILTEEKFTWSKLTCTEDDLDFR